MALAGLALGGVLLLAIAGLFAARALPAASPSAVAMETIHSTSPAAYIHATPSASGLSGSAQPSPTDTPRPTESSAPAPDAEYAAGVVEAGPIQAGPVTRGIWAVRPGHLFTSVDGGITWRSGSVPPADENLTYAQVDTAMVDEMHGWTVRAGPGSDASDEGQNVTLLVYRTTDGGATWQSVTVPGNFFRSRFRLLFADERHGYLAATSWMDGRSTVYRTTDGGVTWTAGARRWLGDDIALSDPTTIWSSVAGGGAMCMQCDQPLLQVSRDGGATWSVADLPGYEGRRTGDWLGIVTAPVFVDASTGYVAVHDAITQDGVTTGTTTFLRTTDAGRTWTGIGRADEYLAGFWLTGPDRWLGYVPAFEAEHVTVTTDAGRTWHSVDYPTRFFTRTYTETTTFFVDRNAGAAVVQADGYYQPSFSLYVTRDGGSTWHPATLPDA